MALTITSWNLQGRRRPDLDAVAEEIRRSGSDVILLQEVQWSQALRLARRLGATATWRFKHWPIVAPPEGLAVVSTGRPVRARTAVLAQRWRFWSWKRRIALRVDLDVDGVAWSVVDVHLGAGVGEAARVDQMGTVLALAGRSRTVIGGDANAGPTSGVIARAEAAGFVDVWRRRHGAEGGATNWRAGPRTDAPVQRIDYLLASTELRVRDVAVAVDAGSPPGEIARFGALSDHVPLTATVS